MYTNRPSAAPSNPRSARSQAVATVTADAGYLSKANLALEDGLEVELLIASRATKGAGMRRQGARGRIPKGLSETQLMERKLRTKRGDRLYRKRAAAIEPEGSP